MILGHLQDAKSQETEIDCKAILEYVASKLAKNKQYIIYNK